MTDYSPISLERNDKGWLLRINGFSEAAAVGAYIWPGGVPQNVHVSMLEAVTEPAVVGDFQITGVTIEAIQAMDPWWANYFSQVSVMTTDPAPAHPAGGGGGGPAAPHVPGADEKERAERLKEYIEDGAHGVLTVTEIAGMFAEEGSTLALAGELAGGFGEVLAVVTVLYATWHAFGEGLEDEHNRGVMFGLVWQVIGHADQEPQYNHDDFYAKMPWDSFDEMKQAFEEGVAEGRGLAQDVKTHNKIAEVIAWKMYHDGLDENNAASIVLTEIWQHATGGSRYMFVDYP